MNELQNRLTNNYKSRIIDYLEQLKRDGYCLAQDMDGNIYLMQYNLKNNRFNVISSIGECYHVLDWKSIHNPFKISIDNIEFIDLIVNNFKTLQMDELHAFTRYVNNLEIYLPVKDLEQDLKNYLKLSDRIGANADKKNLCTPQEQGIALAQINVFYTGSDSKLSFSENKKYYKWNKKNKEFIKLDSHDIRQLIADYFGKPTKEIALNDIEKAMRNVYNEIIVNAAFPVEWNKQKQIRKQLKQDSKAYNKILKLVKNFE